MIAMNVELTSTSWINDNKISDWHITTELAQALSACQKSRI